MNKIIFVGIGIAIMGAVLPAGQTYASEGTWCLRSDDRVDCSQPNFAMCHFSTFGEGGYCSPNVARRWRGRSEQPMYFEAMFAPPAFVPRPMDNPYPSVMRQRPTSWCLQSYEWNECHLQPSFDICLFSAMGTGGSCYPAYYPVQYGWDNGWPAPRVRYRVAHAVHRAKHLASRGEIERAVGDRVAHAEAALNVPNSNGCGQATEVDAETINKLECLDDPATAHAEAIPAGSVSVVNPVKTAVPVARINPAVPIINVMPSCRGAAILGGQHEIEVCVQSENAARGQLSDHWAEFVSADRSSCTASTTLGGGGTYTSLLTCLEMRRDATRLTTGQSSKIVISQ